MRFKPGQLCYYKTEYVLVQFVGKKEPSKGAVESSDPEDWSYNVWLVEGGSSTAREVLVKDSELFDKEGMDSGLFKELL
jgi:hypothetical protein